MILSLFTTIIMVFLWVLQVQCLGAFYHIYKVVETNVQMNVLENIVFDDSVLRSQVKESAREHQLGIRVTNAKGQSICLADGMIDASIYLLDLPRPYELIQEAEQQENLTVRHFFDYEEPDENQVTAPYIQLEPKYLTSRKVLNLTRLVINEETGERRAISISTLITPLYATANAIKSQLFFTIPILLILSFCIALKAAKSISAPISFISARAKNLATEKYTPFDSAMRGSPFYYKEAAQLDKTLSEVSGELLVAENLRREFLSNISHDLRTPLTMIRGYGEMMRDIPGENTLENLQVIIDEAERLNHLVDDLLTLSKLQSGNETEELSPCCLTEMLSAATERYNRLVPHARVEFSYSEKVYVMAYESGLYQAIYNLVDNALKYGGDSKHVEIRQRILGDGKVRVLIRDEGPGISKEDQQYIWNRYYRAAQNRTRTGGSGLGLPIVKEILRQHNAECGVVSEPGKGSTFWFVIPTI